MKKTYEVPIFDVVEFEPSEAFTVLSSLIDSSDNGGRDNEIDNGFWQ